jgi:predicted transcriptional regulator
MRIVGAVLFLTLVAAPAVANVTADLEVRGFAVFQGDAYGLVGWTGSVRDSRLNHPPFQASLHAIGNATLLNYTLGAIDAPKDSPTGVVRQQATLARQGIQLGEVDGRVDFRSTGTHASIRLIPNVAEEVPITGSFTLNASRSIHEALFYDGDAQPYEEGAQFYPPFGGVLSNPGFTLPTAITGRIVVTDYEVMLAGRVIDLRWQTHTQGIPGIGYTKVIKTAVLVIEGKFSFDPGLDPNWQHSLEWIDAELDGDLLLANAQGQGSVNGTPFPSGIHLFQAIGEMTATADYSQSASQWDLEGTPRFVAVNAQTWLGSRTADAIVATGLFLVILGALAKWWRSLVVLLPGLNLAKPLGNPQRTRLLATVAESPGIDQNQLAKTSGLARGTVRHHLRILLRAELLTERPMLGRQTYTLNDSSYEFPIGSVPVTTAAMGFAILRNPLRRAISEALTNLGDAESEAIRRHLAGQGIKVTRDLAWYHLRIMEDAGIVLARRNGRHVTWALWMNVPEVMAQQKKRFLAIGRLERLLEAVPAETANMASIQEALNRSGSRQTSRDLVARLDLLAATGFIIKERNGYRKSTAH